MQATSVTPQATTVAPETINSKDNSNIMTTHNSRNAGNSKNEIDNRTAITVWMTAAAGTKASSWMSSAVELPNKQ
jgi:hypothetical protein